MHRQADAGQDRLAEKEFVTRLGIGTADYADVSSAADLRAAIARIGLPAVLKTRRFGYDGKGQAIIRRMLADKGQTLAAGESMHREFRLEFTPSRTGEDRNFVLRYRLERP